MTQAGRPGKPMAALLGAIEATAVLVAGVALLSMGEDSLGRMLAAFLLFVSVPFAVLIGVLLGIWWGRTTSPWGFARPRQVVLSLLAALALLGFNSLFEELGIVKKPTPRPDWSLAAPTDALVRALQDPDPMKRAVGAEELVRRKDPRAGDLLLPLVADPDPHVRSRAVVLLGLLRDARAVDSIVQAIDDPDYGVRLDAVRSLGAIGDQRAVDPLVGGLDRPNFGGITADALAQIGSPRAVEPLVRFLETMRREDQIRDKNRVAQALTTLTGQSFGGDAKRWREWLESGGRR